jgi:hypothetical protein
VDEGADGTLDTWTVYNGAGDVLTSGTLGRVRLRKAYDAAGYLLREEMDYDADPENQVESTSAYTRGERGELLKTDFDNWEGGGAMTVTQSFDAWLNPLAERTVQDTDGDGVTDFVWVVFFNAEGDVLRFEGDYDGDGVLDETGSKAYYPDGSHEERTEFNDDDQGGADRVEVTVAHPEGTAATFQSDDLNGDGNPEEAVTRTFYENGIVSSMLVESDTDSDGRIDYAVRFLYDKSGAEVGVEFDYDGDGKFD